jgi:hypothetical protein
LADSDSREDADGDVNSKEEEKAEKSRSASVHLKVSYWPDNLELECWHFLSIQSLARGRILPKAEGDEQREDYHTQAKP